MVRRRMGLLRLGGLLCSETVAALPTDSDIISRLRPIKGPTTQINNRTFSLLNEHDVLRGLCSRINPRVAPIINRTKAIVDVAIAPKQVLHFDQMDGTMILSVWWRMQWIDEQLVYNVDPFLPNEVTYLAMETDEGVSGGCAIWTPDLIIFNEAEAPLSGLQSAKALVYPDGLVTWSRPGILKVLCPFDLREFPFDEQTCELKLGSWAYDSGVIDIRVREAYKVAIDMSDFSQSADWTFSAGEAYVEQRKFEVSPNPYEYVYFPIIAKRESGYYMETIFWPSVVICVLNFGAFVIPWDLGERIGYSATMTLAMTVFCFLVSEWIPITGDRLWLHQAVFAAFYLCVAGLLGIVLLTSWQHMQCAADDEEKEEKGRRADALHRDVVAGMHKDIKRGTGFASLKLTNEEKRNLRPGEKVAGPEDISPTNLQKYEGQWHAFDTNHDGTLTRKELSHILKTLNVEEKRRVKMFEKMDADGDGQISKLEFLTFMARMEAGQLDLAERKPEDVAALGDQTKVAPA